MTEKENQQIAEEIDAQVENLALLEFALDVITEVQKDMEKQIKESEAE